MPHNRMSDSDWMNECKDFFSKHDIGGRFSDSDIDMMFRLYNDKLSPNESGKGCSGCQRRVWDKLKAEYERRAKTK